MSSRKLAALAAASFLVAQCVSFGASAENQMGYRLLSPQDAQQLPRNHGALGMDVERAQQISDNGLTFDIIRVKQVHRNSAGARAGFAVGDQIIAIDGLVFPSIATFAAYVGSNAPGSQLSVDYIPTGGGPAQAQRVTLIVGAAGQAAPPAPPAATSTGLSTGTKIAIGVGAAALLGCYEMGCFSHRRAPQPGAAVQPPDGTQAR